MTNMHPTSPLDTTSQNTLLTTNHYLVELLLAFICCDLTLLRTFFATMSLVNQRDPAFRLARRIDC